MMRLAFAVVMLAAIGCGSAENGDEQTTGPSDAGAEAEGGVLSDVTDTPDSEPDAALDASDAHDGEAEVGVDADAAPRCPPVAPANLAATFTEKRLAAGQFHTCGIRDDGTVACWGGEGGKYFGYTVPPAGTFVRLAAGHAHTCGIRTNGEVECWGVGDTYEPLTDGCTWPECDRWLPPPGPFIEITAGEWNTCGLRPDFTIECWGGSEPIEPSCDQFVQMSAYRTLCAVDAEGHMECWPPWSDPDGSTANPGAAVKQVSLDGACACVLYATGDADCWLTLMTNFPKPTIWTEKWSPTGVAAISCGYGQACAILEDRTVDCYESQQSSMIVPAGSPPVGDKFAEITCGQSFCCGMHTDGTSSCWGNGYGVDLPPEFPAGP